MDFGYAGKILRADLSLKQISTVPTADYSDKFIGGRGIAAKIYWDEMFPGYSAYHAENRLIFMTGPLAGFNGLAGSRLQVCGKSPNTTPEGFSYAAIGGGWGVKLKFAGFDGVIIQGESDVPVYLWIHDLEAEIRDASAIWGKSPLESGNVLKREMGNAVNVLTIGKAGENKVSYATIVTDDESSGSSGFGAVMGSKRLKAMAVSGRRRIMAANPGKLLDVTRYVSRLTRDRTITPPNFTIPKKKSACRGCIAGCTKTIQETLKGEKGKSMCQSAGFYIGPAMGYYKQPNDVPFYANRLCNKYGLDTMVIEPLIIWLFRCFKAGILTDEQAGIPVSRFGSLEFIESVIEKIALRDGFGEILARGITSAADSVGEKARGLIGDLVLPGTGEIFVYDPRMYITTGIFYALEPKRPIQQLHEISMLMLHWHAWKESLEGAYVSTDTVRMIGAKFWGSELSADFSTYENKALAAKMIQDRQYANECLVLCNYSWPIAHVRHSTDHVGDSTVESRIFSAVTGKEADELSLYRIGERVFNLQRSILIREGRQGRDADKLPEFSYTVPLQWSAYKPECRFNPEFLLPGENGKTISKEGAVIDRDKFDKVMDEYYALRRWDIRSGLQTDEKLQELGLGDVAEGLVRCNSIVSEIP